MLQLLVKSLIRVLLALPCALIIAWVLFRLRMEYRLRSNPGVKGPVLANNPFRAVIFFWEGAYMQATNQLLDFYNSLFTRFSPTCHVVELPFATRRIIITRDPEHIKTVLTSNFTSFGKGRLFHDSWSPFLGDSIFTTDGALWQRNRALLRPMFTRERVRDLDIFDRWTTRLVEKLPPDGSGVDVCDLFYRMTLDVTTDFLLGHGVGALDNPDGEFTRAFMHVQRKQMILTILHPFRWFVPQRSYNANISILERFIDPFIQSTLNLTTDQLTHLSKSDRDFTFLHNIALLTRDRKVIRDQIMAVLIAGRDTTAATLSWTLYELARCPDVWSKLRLHVLDRVGHQRMPSYDDLKNLTYLSHTINETLRLWPAVPYNLRSCIESSTLPGQPGEPDIAALPDDIVLYSTLAMQRRPDLYPPTSSTFADPAIFSPDRWENWTPKPWQYVPFNGGPRICIGQNFALTEMAFVLVRLLQKFDRLEYRGKWSAQYHKVDIVGCPGQGVPVAFYQPESCK
ncbi:hypothetical protein L249_8737 [Ophiocordyceps polyrhachis-furcata BCC 54312]|uniref:Cytochrome P450 alkane hydroxylase n=1 Tax=Ophiocordyceps polyrhachis-furcata BCC 54312 TaxID=1330021 RepID=A0A367L733_9HYPO|nr:hypothetical protein L249_8737 [Ophiocordyceps polyrhachis-furcata BCC 54312]